MKFPCKVNFLDEIPVSWIHLTLPPSMEDDSGWLRNPERLGGFTGLLFNGHFPVNRAPQGGPNVVKGREAGSIG